MSKNWCHKKSVLDQVRSSFVSITCFFWKKRLETAFCLVAFRSLLKECNLLSPTLRSKENGQTSLLKKCFHAMRLKSFKLPQNEHTSSTCLISILHCPDPKCTVNNRQHSSAKQSRNYRQINFGLLLTPNKIFKNIPLAVLPDPDISSLTSQ